MAFADEVRMELTRAECEKRCCAQAELTALILCSGGVSFRGPGRYALYAQSENAAVIRRAFAIAKRFFDATPLLRAVKNPRLGERLRYELSMEGDEAANLLTGLGLFDPKAAFGLRFTPPAAALRRECCRRAYLRGAYLACGWVASPEKPYHLEFATPDDTQADAVSRVLARCECPVKTVIRKNQSVVYIKEGERVCTALALLGASGAVMAMENARAMKQMRNAVNRQVNCDAGNLDKTVDAAQKQLSDIEYIRTHAGLHTLPAPLRQVAEARVSNMESSLAELGEMLEPPIGKSGVNNRLRRIGLIADRLREGGQ